MRLRSSAVRIAWICLTLCCLRAPRASSVGAPLWANDGGNPQMTFDTAEFDLGVSPRLQSKDIPLYEHWRQLVSLQQRTFCACAGAGSTRTFHCFQQVGPISMQQKLRSDSTDECLIAVTDDSHHLLALTRNSSAITLKIFSTETWLLECSTRVTNWTRSAALDQLLSAGTRVLVRAARGSVYAFDVNCQRDWMLPERSTASAFSASRDAVIVATFDNGKHAVTANA